MGKAKRFNSYDSMVDDKRKIAQAYGQQRQNMSGITSTFRNSPLSPIAVSSGAASGTGTGKFLTVSLAADQTTNIGANDHVEFDTKDEDGGIVLQTGAGQADGIFELGAGKKYQLSAHLRPEFSGATGQLVIAWYDITNTAEIGSRAIYESQTHASHNANQPVAEAIVTPSTNITVEVRIISVTALTALANEYCVANLFEIALGGSGSGGGGTGTNPLTTKGDLFTYDTAAQRLPVGADGLFLKADSTQATGLIWASSSGSQTPWTADVDADGFDLNDLSNLEFRATTAAPSAGTAAIWLATADMVSNIATGNNFFWQIQQTTKAKLDVDELELRTPDGGTQVNHLDFINTDTSPTSNDVPGDIRFRGYDDAGVTIFDYVTIEAEQEDTLNTDKEGLLRIKMYHNNSEENFMTFNQSETGDIWSYRDFTPSGSGINLGNATLEWDNLFINTITGVTSSKVVMGSDIDLATFDIQNIDRARFVVSSGTVAAAGDPSIYLDGVGNMTFNVPTGDFYQYSIQDSNIAKIDDGDTQFIGLTGVMSLQLINRDSTPIDLDQIGAIAFRADDDAVGENISTYANILAVMDDVSSGTTEGTMHLQVAEGGTLTTYLSLNKGRSQYIDVARDIDMEGNNIREGGVLYLVEQAAADADTAGRGQLWVKTATPNQLWFTNDAGTDVQLGVSGGSVSFPITPTINDHGNVGTVTEDIDLSGTDGHVHKITLTGNPTLTFSNPPSSGTQMEFEIEYVQDATGGRTVTQPASVSETVTISSTASSTTIVTYRTNDGGTTYHAIPALRGSVSLSAAFLPLAGGTMSGNLDMNGNEIVIDVDADTTIGDGGVDDNITFTVGGTNVMDLLPTSILVEGGINLDMDGNDIILDVDADSKINMTGDDAMSIEMGAVAVADFTATTIGFNVGLSMGTNDISQIGSMLLSTSGASTGTNHEIWADTDAIYINAPTGDSINFTINAVTVAQMGSLSLASIITDNPASLILKRLDATPTDTDEVGNIEFTGPDSAANDTIYGKIRTISRDVSNTTEDGEMIFSIMVGGSQTDIMQIIATKLDMLQDIDMNGKDLDFVKEIVIQNQGAGGDCTINSNGAGANELQIECSDFDMTASASDLNFSLFADRNTESDNVNIIFDADNSSGTRTTMASIISGWNTNTAGSEIGNIRFTVQSPSGGMASGIEIQGVGNAQTQIGFHNSAVISKPAVTGSRADTEAALANLLTALANYGLITNGTSA